MLVSASRFSSQLINDLPSFSDEIISEKEVGRKERSESVKYDEWANALSYYAAFNRALVHPTNYMMPGKEIFESFGERYEFKYLGGIKNDKFDKFFHYGWSVSRASSPWTFQRLMCTEKKLFNIFEVINSWLFATKEPGTQCNTY